MEHNESVIRSGMMRKKGNRMWGDRYFILKGPVLYYYLKKSDNEPKGTLILNGSCKLSPIRVDSKGKQFIFDISWPVLENSTNPNDDVKRSLFGNKNSAKLSPSTTIGGVAVGSVTGGVGLFASMAVASGQSRHNTASGTNSNTTNNNSNEPVNHRLMTLSCETRRDAELWIEAITEQIRELSDSVLGIPYVHNSSHGSSIHIDSRRLDVPSDIKLTNIEEWVKYSKWKVFNTLEGVRIFKQNMENEESVTDETPCLRVNLSINGSANEVYSLLMEMPQSCRSGVMKSVRVLSTIENHTDVIHLTLEQLYLHPTWTAPRDFCLTRYWKQNKDGSYLICLDSTTHQDCPLIPGYVRADLHAVYYISPIKDELDDEQESESMLTMIAKVDPKGWIWKSYGYQHRFLQQILLHVLDIRDALDSERYVPINFDPVAELSPVSSQSVAVAGQDGSEATINTASISTVPPPTLPQHMWCEADASTFRVRGHSYMQDKVKTNSMPSLFKLAAVDVYEVPETTHNISAHPRHRVAMAHARGEKFFAFVLNIMVPGPPYLCFVMTYTGDKALLEEDTPFARIARPFFFGTDDDFRNNRFKLIPKVIDGNMIVKMAVKDTPTLLGNKLKQYYYRDDHYFEIDVDVGSSSVARNIVGVAIGYSKAIVVDMGVCLQGNEENELPEVMIGATQCIHVDMSLAKKL